jgi:hypothetical protein
MTIVRYALIALALTAAACTSPAPAPPAAETTAAPDAATAAVPQEFAALASAAMPGITITGGELNDSKTQYEVTGTMPNGDEVELDLEQSNGAWAVNEIQRDVAWASVPEAVRAAAVAAKPFEPVRVIESRQAADGAIVYELFAAAQGGPALEVRWHEGKAAVVPPAS